ncbi:MAG TPA: response regulator [Longimicrobiales bacterium]|nr:response regulator [Longimicrobiales bacterium]
MSGPGTRPRARHGWREVISGGEPGASILVVDDDPEVRSSLSKLLTRLGYSVRVAASAEEADQWLSGQRFHICLLDIELPRMKGVEFLGWALSRDPEMAVVMLTGLDAPDVAVRCIEQGARTYLTKPVEAEFLRLALRDAVAMRTLLVERNALAGA